MKIHLMRSSRSTWCGRPATPTYDDAIPVTHLTRDRSKATCMTCLKADEAEQSKEDAATGGR